MSDRISIPASELLKSVPGVFGIRLDKEPQHDVIETDGKMEIRRYRPALMAEITIRGTRREAAEKSFEHLARYIFGSNVEREKMAMTAPVIQTESKDDAVEAWTMAFFLSNSMSIEEAPKPVDPEVKLHIEPERLVAVAHYSGNNTDENAAEAKGQLEQWVASRSGYARDGDVYFAQYDAPFVIPFLKKNEAMVNLRKGS